MESSKRGPVTFQLCYFKKLEQLWSGISKPLEGRSAESHSLLGLSAAYLQLVK